MRTRNKNLHVRLTDQEMEDLRRKVERAGVSVQSFLIAAIYDTQLKECPNEAYLEILRKIREASRQIAEIALIEEKKGFIDPAKLWNAIRDMQVAASEFSGKGGR